MTVATRTCLSAVVLVLLAGCSPKPDAPPPKAQVIEPPAPAPLAPVAVAPLGRAEILDAVARAASAYAAGEEYPEAAKLGGRQFTVRLAVACDEGSAGGAVYDAKAGVLRLSIRPETWTEEPRVVGLVAESDTEAIEGFWVRWPWMKAEGCPRRPPPIEGAPPATPATKPPAKRAVTPAAPPATPPAAKPTVGLVRLFGKDSSRLRRRGARGYEATVKLEAPPPAGAYRLVISGRIVDPADHRPIRCGAEHRNIRPTCLVLVEPDRVAFETGDGEAVAEWTD